MKISAPRPKRLSHLRLGDMIVVTTPAGDRPGLYFRELTGSRKQLVGFHQVVLLRPDRTQTRVRKVHADYIKKARVCRECGCTDFFACEGGCSWIARDLCSTHTA